MNLANWLSLNILSTVRIYYLKKEYVLIAVELHD